MSLHLFFSGLPPNIGVERDLAFIPHTMTIRQFQTDGNLKLILQSLWEQEASLPFFLGIWVILVPSNWLNKVANSFYYSPRITTVKYTDFSSNSFQHIFPSAHFYEHWRDRSCPFRSIKPRSLPRNILLTEKCKQSGCCLLLDTNSVCPWKSKCLRQWAVIPSVHKRPSLSVRYFQIAGDLRFSSDFVFNFIFFARQTWTTQ